MSYARALMAWAEEANLSQEVYAQSSCLLNLIDENPTFSQLLHTPMVTLTKKVKAVSAILNECAPHLIKLVSLVVKNKREKLLKRIILGFQKLYREKNGIIKTHVDFAQEINDELQMAIHNYIAKTFDKTVEMDFEIHPEIIGGFRITIEDKLLDKSVKGELEKIRQQFL